MTLIFNGIDYSACRRGVEIIEYEDHEEILWPRCEISDCGNGVCIGMSKSLCYIHGIDLGAFTETEFEADRKAKHGDEAA